MGFFFPSSSSFFFCLPLTTLGRERKEGVKITLRWGWFHSQPWNPVRAGQADTCGWRAGEWAAATGQQRPKVDEFRACRKLGRWAPEGCLVPCAMCMAHTCWPPHPTLGFQRGRAPQVLAGLNPVAQQQIPILDLGTPCCLLNNYEKCPRKQNTNRKWGGWGEKAIACFCAGRSGGSGPRRQTQSLQCLAKFRCPAPGQRGEEGMALGSASRMSALSRHLGNQEGAGKEPRSI